VNEESPARGGQTKNPHTEPQRQGATHAEEYIGAQGRLAIHRLISQALCGVYEYLR